MFDFDVSATPAPTEATSRPRMLILSDNTAAAAADLAQALGAPDAVATLSEAELAADWPAYVIARARTGGAFIAEEGVAQAPTGALRLTRGVIFGRPASALVVAGQLVFMLDRADAEDARRAA